MKKKNKEPIKFNSSDIRLCQIDIVILINNRKLKQLRKFNIEFFRNLETI